MLFNQILLTFDQNVEIKKSVEDLDQYDIIKTDIQRIFKSKVDYLKYYFDSNKKLINFYHYYQILNIYINSLVLYNYHGSYKKDLFICLMVETINIFVVLNLDKYIIDFFNRNILRNNVLTDVRNISKLQLINTVINYMIYLYLNISFIFFENQDSTIYYLYLYKIKLGYFMFLLNGVIAIIYFNLNSEKCIITRNLFEKYKHKIFNCTYTFVQDDWTVYKIINFESEKIEKVNGDICAICKEEYCKDDKILKLKCNHIFHKDCIKLWFNKELTCPYCRQLAI
ncbi:Ring finger domain [seawater metagenome]|uniref:Ring finger domain n=1 Tax=seawater metagenome TaxID=1561972 RepID=A0A5E8CLM0_9ZZZZ